MPSIAAALLVSFACTSLGYAEDSKFEFTVSGALASKLEPDARVLIWSPVTATKPNWARFSVKDMPISVPYKQLATKHIWITSFISPVQRRTVFSIGMAPELFDRPGRIDLKLDCPTPRIRPSFLGKLQFQYRADIGQRMWYEELPSWDKENQRIVAAEPPTMRIVRASDGRKLQDSAMTPGCLGSKWWATIDPRLDIVDGTDLQFAVRFDSGGLWEPIEAKLNFTYHKSSRWPLMQLLSKWILLKPNTICS